MSKSCLSLFAVCAVATFVVACAVSLCHADPCTCDATVCDFVIDASNYCANGVGSGSIMPGAETPRNYIGTNAPCGVVWHRVDWIAYPTSDTCGSAASPLCT